MIKCNTFRLLTLITFISIGSAISNASETNDSTQTSTLDEVVVEGRTQRVIKHGVEYIPGKKMKKMAIDANSLLAQMMIPSLRTDVRSNTVKAIDGTPITYFIDYIPAGEAELAGMRTEDVLRVEVLDHPDDPRFQGAAKVINFIMQKYIWGGYTKIQGRGSVVAGESWGGSVYSKFLKNKWLFDLSVETNGSHNKNNQYSDDVETYRDIDFKGNHYNRLERTLHSGDNYLRRHNNTGGLFRFSYFDDKVYFRHAIYLTGYNSFNRNSSSINFTDNVIPSTSSHTADKSTSYSPMVTGEYNFTLPKQNFLNINWSFRYDRLKNNSSHTFGHDASIFNDNTENNYTPFIGIYYSKNFNHNNTLVVNLSSSNSIYNTDYTGSSYDGKQDVVSSSNDLLAAYYQSWPFGLSIYPSAGACYTLNKVGGKTRISEINPKLGLNLQYQTPNQKNFLMMNVGWGIGRPSASASNSAIIQSNELLWMQGNPDLRISNQTRLAISYSLVPVNWFNMYAMVSYVNNSHRPVVDYYTLQGYDGVVGKTFDDSNRHDYTASVSASFRMLNNSLTLQLTGDAERVQFTGINPKTWQWLRGNVSASYYLRNFMFSLSYATPEKAVYGNSLNEFSNTGSFYTLRVSYSVKNFKASLSFSNWFDHYRKWTTEYNSSRYSYLRTTHDRGQSLSINLSYTFNYGRKINTNDELFTAGSATSGALGLK